MIKHLNEIFIKITSIFYEHILHEKMTKDVQLFLKNLLYVGLGLSIASVLSFAFNVLGGRVLGPSNFGEFTLVYSISMFLYIPMIIGITTALVKYCAEGFNFKRNRSIISTAYILVLIFTIISIVVYYIFSSLLSRVFFVSLELFYFSIGLAVLYSFYLLVTNTLIGLHKMNKYALFQPIYSIILILSFFLFIFIGKMSYKSMTFSLYIAYGMTGLLILIFLHIYLKLEFDKSWAKKLLKYGTFALIGGFSFILYTNIDKIIINNYMTTADVGIYKAYVLASETIIGVILGIFITVFFPTVSKYKEKITIYAKINKFVPYIFCLGFPCLLIFELIILKLIGNEYPIDLTFLIFFAIAGLLILINGFYAWLMNSVGKEGIKTTAIGGLICAIVNIVLNFAFIPLYGILGSIFATIISYTVFTFIIIKRKNLFATIPI